MDNQQFDQFFKDALHNADAPVPDHVWANIITDKAVADNLTDIKQPVSDKVWDAIEFDEVAHQKLRSWHAHVPADMWSRIVKERKRRRVAAWQVSIIGGIFAILFTGLVWHKFTKTPISPLVLGSHGAETITNSNAKTMQSGTAAISEKSGGSMSTEKLPETQVSAVDNTTNLVEKAVGVTMPISDNQEFNTTKRAGNASVKRVPSYTQNNKGNTNNTEHFLTPSDEFPITPENTVFSKQNWLTPFTANKLASFSLASDAHLRGRMFGSNITDCPSVNSRPHKEWALEMYAGPALGIAAHGTQPSGNDFVRRFDSATSAAVTYSAGFRVSKYLGTGLYAKAGLQLTQLAQKFAYQSENERKTVTIITVRNVVRGPGDTVRVTDTSSFVQVGYANYKSRNLVRSIDIPLTLTYNVVNNDRFQFGVTTGVIVNLQTWYQGTVFDKNMSTVHIGEELGYKNNIGVAFMAGLHLAKPITERLGVFAEPYFRYNMQGLTSPSSPYKQHYHQVGMQLGIKWKMNNKSSNF